MKNIIINCFLYRIQNKIFSEIKDCEKSYWDYQGSDYPESEQPPERVKKTKRYLELLFLIQDIYKATFVETIFYI